MAWSVSFSDDAWRELAALEPGQREAVEAELADWLDDGPVHTRVYIDRGILSRENRLECGVRLVFTRPDATAGSVLILKVWPSEESGL